MNSAPPSTGAENPGGERVCIRPPGLGAASSTVTAKPAADNRRAASRPEAPAPIIRIEDVISETFIMNTLCTAAALQFNKELAIAPNALKRHFDVGFNKDSAGRVAGILRAGLLGFCDGAWIKKGKLFYELTP